MLERIFGRQAQTRILEFLLGNKNTLFNLSEIAEKTGVSPSTVSRIIEKFIEEGIVIEVGKWRQMRVVKLNEKNPKVILLLKFLNEIRSLKA